MEESWGKGRNRRLGGADCRVEEIATVGIRVGVAEEEDQKSSKMVVNKGVVFVPENESIRWAKKCIVCGIKDGLSAKEVVEFIQSRGYLKTKVNHLAENLWGARSKNKRRSKAIELSMKIRNG